MPRWFQFDKVRAQASRLKGEMPVNEKIIDFQTTVTELNPFDAPVISIRRKPPSQNGQ